MSQNEIYNSYYENDELHEERGVFGTYDFDGEM